MDISELIREVRNEHEHQPSEEDQVRALTIAANHGYVNGGRFTQSELEDLAEKDGVEFDCPSARPALDNLVEIGYFSRSLPSNEGPFVISERLDEIINGRFEEVFLTDREALIDHIQDTDSSVEGDESAVADGGVTPRTVVADAFDIVPDGVEAHLRAGEPTDQRERLNTAIESIASHEEIEQRPNYGKVLLRRSGYRYRFTERAKENIEQEDDDADH